MRGGQLARRRQPVAQGLDAEGIRLARYFRMLAMRKQPTAEDKKAPGPTARIIAAAEAWRKDYRRFLNTSEGHGVAFLLAELKLETADAPSKTVTDRERDRLRQEARALLRGFDMPFQS